MKLTSVLTGIFLTLSAASSTAEVMVMKITLLDGQNLTVNLAEDMWGGVWVNTNDPNAPMNFYVYSGIPGKDENGRPVDYESEERSGKVYLDIPLTTLDCVTLSDSDSSVTEIGSTTINVDIINGVIFFSGVERPVRVSIVNASGKMTFDRVIATDIRLDLKPFGQGVYIINVDGSTFKFLIS